VTCAVMRSADFERLLGPYEDVWRFEVLRKVGAGCGDTLRRLGAYQPFHPSRHGDFCLSGTAGAQTTNST
jgi:hypothetical protein